MLEKKMLDDLIASLRFWYSKKAIKVDEHYEFMFDMNNTNAVTIRILKKFPGVIAEYSNLQMVTDNQISYDFNVIANPNLCDVESKRFKNFTGDIFRNIIHSSIENAIKDSNENGNTDSLKSDSERAIHEEVSTVSEERVPERKPRKKTVRRNKKVHSEVQQSAADSSTGNQS
jgi:hypothetical protein